LQANQGGGGGNQLNQAAGGGFGGILQANQGGGGGNQLNQAAGGGNGSILQANQGSNGGRGNQANQAANGGGSILQANQGGGGGNQLNQAASGGNGSILQANQGSNGGRGNQANQAAGGGNGSILQANQGGGAGNQANQAANGGGSVLQANQSAGLSCPSQRDIVDKCNSWCGYAPFCPQPCCDLLGKGGNCGRQFNPAQLSGFCYDVYYSGVNEADFPRECCTQPGISLRGSVSATGRPCRMRPDPAGAPLHRSSRSTPAGPGLRALPARRWWRSAAGQPSCR